MTEETTAKTAPPQEEEPTAPANEETAETPPPSPEERLKSAEEEAERNRTDYLRALAEAENVRRRADKRVEEARKFALEGFARDLITLADNADRALDAVRAQGASEDSPATRSMREGLEMIRSEMDRTFEKHGIVRIEAVGKPFDPNLHQALSKVPSDDLETDHVAREEQPGYLLNGRLLRPAMVHISAPDFPG